jgi:hypothetical protein
MSTTISPVQTSEQVYTFHLVNKRPNAISRFFKWAASEDQERHIGWVGITVILMTAICFPLTMAVVLMNGAVFGLIVAAMFPLVLVVVTNLASLPTRYTIPCFFLGTLIELLVIGFSFFI